MYKATVFILLLITWIVLSGLIDPFHIGLGVISSALVTWLSSDLLFEDRSKSILTRCKQALRFPSYLLWLLWQIVLANIHVLKISFSPNLNDKIQPQLVKFRTGLKTDFQKYVLAQSITLTPGTVTLDIKDDVFIIHAISDHAAKGLVSSMAQRIHNVFAD
ncbi:MAG: Na+/H+ antiporter subunit E [Verrucomicrobiales bacterium]|tara:strand:- start:17 stop:499 length:483 start_codon:yes stop_codon:yes gene_type:complete